MGEREARGEHSQTVPAEKAEETKERIEWAEDFGVKNYKTGPMPSAHGEWTYGTGRAKDGWVPDYEAILQHGTRPRFERRPRDQTWLRYSQKEHHDRDEQRAKLGLELRTGLQKITGPIKEQNRQAAEIIRKLQRTASRNIVRLVSQGGPSRFGKTYEIWGPEKGSPGIIVTSNNEFKFYSDTLDKWGFPREDLDEVALKFKRKSHRSSRKEKAPQKPETKSKPILKTDDQISSKNPFYVYGENPFITGNEYDDPLADLDRVERAALNYLWTSFTEQTKIWSELHRQHPYVFGVNPIVKFGWEGMKIFLRRMKK
ncbi:hypothetical protein E3E12_07845 [Formicincola oecophyllae]|uniref:Uncharacterized protein n=1 Tax=Formicincola oecophyllae TaxID=2558361 RepID=A0A4Y6UC09_9PROT|nr:hypothetical protein [Formicincola oecophyllae]QDH14108.1 hypothetical protein E3E12_07845 [Formicincola oecophyllae]